MTPQEQRHFELLKKGPCVLVEYVNEYYGLPWPLPNDVRPDFEAWQSQLRKRATCEAGSVSRYELETFMQQKNLVPKKWMAAWLGMKDSSFEELLARLKTIGMQPQRYIVYPDLIAESLSEDLVSGLSGLRFRTFSDHNSFCERLHAELGRKRKDQDRRPVLAPRLIACRTIPGSTPKSLIA